MSLIMIEVMERAQNKGSGSENKVASEAEN